MEQPLIDGGKSRIATDEAIARYKSVTGLESYSCCSLKHELIITKNNIFNSSVNVHCGLVLSDEILSVAPADVNAVTVYKAPYQWAYLVWALLFISVGSYLASKKPAQSDDLSTIGEDSAGTSDSSSTWNTIGIFFILFAVMFIGVFAYHACYPKTHIQVETKLKAPFWFTWSSYFINFSYVSSTGTADIAIGSEEDTAQAIFAPDKNESEIGRWTVSKKDSNSSLIVTDKRVAFRDFKTMCGLTLVEKLESIKPDQIQGVVLHTSPYVISRLYCGTFITIVGIIVIASAKGSSLITYSGAFLLAIGLIWLACLFCKKLDRIVFTLKSPFPIGCFFIQRSIEMEVPTGEGAHAFGIIKEQITKHLKAGSSANHAFY